MNHDNNEVCACRENSNQLKPPGKDQHAQLEVEELFYDMAIFFLKIGKLQVLTDLEYQIAERLFSIPDKSLCR